METKQSYTMTRQEALLFRAVLADRIEELRDMRNRPGIYTKDYNAISERLEEYVEIINKLNAFGL